MTIQQLKELARQKGILSGYMKKEDIIRSIQLAEGKQFCFGTKAVRDCGQYNCQWRDDCVAGG